MEQNLITFEKALKENYLPVWRNQLSTEPTALLSKLKPKPLTSNKITASAPIGLSGGFGFGAEGQATPTAGNVRFERFTTEAKDMYCNVEISQKAVRLTGTSGAMANALDVEVKGAYEAAKWNFGRSLLGNGTGKLTTVVAQTDASKLVKVKDCKYIKEGLIVDFYPESATSVDDATEKDLRIVAVNRTKDNDGNCSILLNKIPSVKLVDGFLTLQNSFNREITGLGAIFDKTVDSIYGLSKTDNPFLKPIEIDANDNIDDGTITKALREAKNIKNSEIDMLLCGDDAYDEYVNYLRVNNIRVEEVTKTLTGGFKAIKFAFGTREIDIVNESFIASDEMWGVATDNLELHMQEWAFAELKGGGIFNLMENKSVYRALLCNFGNLICTNPGGCVRIYNCI